MRECSFLKVSTNEQISKREREKKLNHNKFYHIITEIHLWFRYWYHQNLNNLNKITLHDHIAQKVKNEIYTFIQETKKTLFAIKGRDWLPPQSDWRKKGVALRKNLFTPASFFNFFLRNIYIVISTPLFFILDKLFFSCFILDLKMN